MIKLAGIFDILTNKQSWQQALITWFQQEQADYPWRKTRDPWAILVAEMMLQQTQINTVIEKNYYRRFLDRFPTASCCAEADIDEVLAVWQGLGYYRRARSLQQIAKIIVADFAGEFPNSKQELLELPGIGEYTAAALMSFAFEVPTALVDTNVIRLFSRLFNWQKNVQTAASKQQFWSWAESLISQQDIWNYNSALMELGQKICTKKTPRCHDCPVQSFCQTTEPTTLPITHKAASIVKDNEYLIWLQKGTAILLEQIPAGERRAGLWTLPRIVKPESTWSPIYSQKYGITKYRITAKVYQVTSKVWRELLQKKQTCNGEQQWVDYQQLEQKALTAPTKKMIAKIIPILSLEKIMKSKKEVNL